jgi:hypothetical protein
MEIAGLKSNFVFCIQNSIQVLQPVVKKNVI